MYSNNVKIILQYSDFDMIQWRNVKKTKKTSAFAVTNLCTGGDWGLAIITGILQTTSMHAIKQWETTLTIQLMGDNSPYLVTNLYNAQMQLKMQQHWHIQITKKKIIICIKCSKFELVDNISSQSFYF